VDTNTASQQVKVKVSGHKYVITAGKVKVSGQKHVITTGKTGK